MRFVSALIVTGFEAYETICWKNITLFQWRMDLFNRHSYMHIFEEEYSESTSAIAYVFQLCIISSLVLCTCIPNGKLDGVSVKRNLPLTCADQEKVANGGPTLTTFFFFSFFYDGKEDSNSTKSGPF